MAARALGLVLLIGLAAAPFVPMAGMRQYTIHVLVQIFVWSFIGGAWALMGRFGLTSSATAPSSGWAPTPARSCGTASGSRPCWGRWPPSCSPRRSQ